MCRFLFFSAFLRRATCCRSVLRLWRRAFLGLCLGGCLAGAAMAATSGGALITRLEGRIRVVPAGSVGGVELATGFLRLAPGDRLRSDGPATLQLVYLANGRQEIWRSPITLQIDNNESRREGNTPEPEVRMLSALLVRQLQKTPASDARSKVGMVRLRAVDTSTPLTRSELESAYRTLRRESPPTDRTPELYLFSGLLELGEFALLRENLDDLQRLYPNDPLLPTLREQYLAAIREWQAGN